LSFSYLVALLVRNPLIILATIAYGSFSLVISFFDHEGEKQAAVARAWARMLLRIGGVTVTVRGLERLDPKGGYVFASNHVSYYDTPLILSHIPARFRFLANDYLFKIPFLGTHLARAGHIPVPKGNPREAVRTMAEAGRIVRERGISLLVFPEGGRAVDGVLQEFREGAAMIAIKAGAPLVPVALRGTMHVLRMHSAHVKPAHVELCIGVPIPTAGMVARDRGALSEQVRAAVAEMLE